MKKMILSLVIAAVTLCSCGVNVVDGEKEAKEAKWVDLLSNFNEKGRIYGEAPKKYIDYDTMKVVPLCAKPNCTHTTSDCIGHIIGDTPILTDDYIYYFSSVEGVNELKNGEREFYINSKLCRVSLDSSETEIVVEFHDCAPADYDGVLLYDDKIYFTGDDLNPTDDSYGHISSQNAGGEHYICSIDLKTREYTNYGMVYSGEGYADDSHANICGFINSKILINYQCRPDMTEIDESKPWRGQTMLMFEFDPKTNEITESDIPTRPISTNTKTQTVIYWDDEAKKTVLIIGNERRELDIDVGTYATVFNNKLFVRDTGKWYDLSNMSEHDMGKYGENEHWVVGDYYDGCYILITYFKTVKLTEDELIALGG